MIETQTRVKGLIYDGMARTREEVGELDGRSPLVDHEPAHPAVVVVETDEEPSQRSGAG